HYDLDPGWHIYWKDPGASGQPTEVTFGAPDGFDFDAISWPAPKAFKASRGTADFGYDDEALLFTTVTAPATVHEGEVVTLSANSHWLVCAESCIPGQANLSLDLPVE